MFGSQGLEIDAMGPGFVMVADIAVSMTLPAKETASSAQQAVAQVFSERGLELSSVTVSVLTVEE